MKIISWGLVFTGLLASFSAKSQNMIEGSFRQGLRVMTSDSSHYIKFDARFQSLFMAEHDLENNDLQTSFLIRRARLKFGGYVYTPRVKYKLELGLSNRDLGNPIPQVNNSSGIILDAVVKWRFFGNAELWVGQTKLPGNRERVISSGALQFVDRSLLNSRYNIDRDIGIQLHHFWSWGDAVVREAFAVSQGEGKNISSGNYGGYDYTARIEFLPMGEFEDKGDYFGADLAREEKPKLSIGLSYDYNHDAFRSRGNTGNFLSEPRTLSTIFADMMFKYRGFSLMAEYARKEAAKGSVVRTDTFGLPQEYFYTGTGFNVQAGYLLQSDWELAVRYTTISPEASNKLEEIDMYTLGISKYIVGHSLKVQGDVSLSQKGGVDEMLYRLQLEFSL